MVPVARNLRVRARAAAIAAPGYAQTGQIKGKVVDANGKPVDGATVTIEGSDSGSRKSQSRRNKNGEYIQIGLQPGQYKVTATKDELTQTLTSASASTWSRSTSRSSRAAAAATRRPRTARRPRRRMRRSRPRSTKAWR